MIVIRPFSEVDANLVLIECESNFLMLSALLIYLSKQDRWTRTIEYAYLGVLFSASSATAATVLGKSFTAHLLVANLSKLIRR